MRFQLRGPRRRAVRPLAVAAVTVLAVFSFAAAKSPGVETAAAAPTGFDDRLLTSVELPTALAFTPDGRLLIATKPGKLRVYANGALLTASALDITAKVCSNSERGLLGVAVDPGFAANRSIFVYYTFNKFGNCGSTTANRPVNRISRFTLSDTNVVDPASETVLIDNIPSWNGNHNAGDLQFGKDGLLYVTVGDGGCDYAGNSGCAGSNDAARDRHVLLGKVLCITRTGANSSRQSVPGS
ncbi:MAG: sorbosone dehydrogenase family protein [Gaiellaceae bacterium]